jgi:hypothetical protein
MKYVRSPALTIFENRASILPPLECVIEISVREVERRTASIIPLGTNAPEDVANFELTSPRGEDTQ